MNLRNLLSALFVTAGILSCGAFDWSKDIRIHCQEDTVVINRYLTDLFSESQDPGERVLSAAMSLEGMTYKGGTLDEESTERLNINVCEGDCMTFVENSLALAKASMKKGSIWTDFSRMLENIRYRRGELGDYTSRLHYVSDWITDNVYRGNLRDVTAECGQDGFMTKSLSYMSRHPEQYPALADEAMLEKIKNLEMGFYNYKIPYIKKESLLKKRVTENLKSGDIIVFLSKDPDLDATHVGLISMENGTPYLLHASSAKGKVIKEKYPLGDYMKHEGRACPGVRIIRAEEL